MQHSALLAAVRARRTRRGLPRRSSRAGPQQTKRSYELYAQSSMATTPSKRPPSLPLVGTASPGDYLLQEEALPTPPRLSSMLEDLESQAASELESYGDATFGDEWTGRDLKPRKEKKNLKVYFLVLKKLNKLLKTKQLVCIQR